MIIPDEVLIGPFRYRVAYVNDLHVDGRSVYGSANPTKKLIQLDADNDPEQQLSTFLHECLHAIDHHLAVGLSEKTVKRLGTALAALLIDNNLLAPDPPASTPEGA